MKIRSEFTCPLELVHDMVKGKWKLIIIFNLRKGSCSFSGLLHSIEGISQKMLLEQLNELKEYDVCANISCETCSYTGQCWEGERGQKVAIDRAVEIAKGGGIEW